MAILCILDKYLMPEMAGGGRGVGAGGLHHNLM